MAATDRALVEQSLEKLTTFLHKYLPLANAHVADFLIEDYWNRFVPETIRQDLLELSEADLACLPSCMLYEDAGGAMHSEAVGGVFTEARADANDCSGGLVAVCAETGASERTVWDRTRLLQWGCKDLKTFILEAQHLTLPYLEVLTDLTDLRGKLQHRERNRKVIRQFMSEKKSHEVEVMAEVCSELAVSQHINTVIDIGSGRGYLSSHLCLMHGLSVLAVDSSNLNTKSAQTRNQRLKKHWAGLLRNADKSVASSPASTQAPTSTDNIPAEEQVAAQCIAEENEMKKQVKCVQITQFVTPETNLQMLVQKHLACHKDATMSQEVANSSNMSDGVMSQTGDSVTYLSDHLTEGVNSHPIDSVTSHAIDTVTEGVTSHCVDSMTSHPADPLVVTSSRVLLTGLHTCGNLAASMLEMFSAHGVAGAVCNVGCCYHHLDEAFTRSPFEGDERPAHMGFPMSGMLQSRGFQLGRNARMLASQTPARMASAGKVSHQSLFYRALLQTMLRDMTGHVSDDWHVGKIFTKSKDFPDYVERALRKLQLDDYGQARIPAQIPGSAPVTPAYTSKMTHDRIIEYETRHAVDELRLTAFVQLRATLAPVVEATILLDRLLYLHEQEQVAECHLVQLFDTVTSPRCYGILAVRR